MSNRMLVSVDDVRDEVRALVKKSNQIKVAAKLGVTPQQVNDVVKDRKPPGRVICAKLGYERVPNAYRRIPRKP